MIQQLEIEDSFSKHWNTAKGKDLELYETFFDLMAGEDVDLDLPDQIT